MPDPYTAAAGSVASVLIRERCHLRADVIHVDAQDGGDAIVLVRVRAPAAKIDESIASRAEAPR